MTRSETANGRLFAFTALACASGLALFASSLWACGRADGAHAHEAATGVARTGVGTGDGARVGDDSRASARTVGGGSEGANEGREGTQRPSNAAANPNDASGLDDRSPAASARGAAPSAAPNGARPNVLFLPIDDLNDWIGCLGQAQAKTPNLDRLAASGLLFTDAHCAAPSCNPSRVAVLTGRAPYETGVYANGQPPLANCPDLPTLPGTFRANGYFTAAGGKVYHDYPGFDRPADWDERYRWEAEMSAEEMELWNVRVFDWKALDTKDDAQPDYKVASWAADFLSKEHDQPFFLAAGIFRPHLPWYVPAEYFDAHPLDAIERPPILQGDLADVPAAGKKIARENSGHEHIVEQGKWEQAIQAYLASIAFADRQVGRILDALENGPHARDTIVVAWGDHGYHLGEKEHWHKFTLWERATHTPLIVRAPGVTEPGTRCERPVGLIDLFPTLVELCDLPAVESLNGHGLEPLLREPARAWPHPVLTSYRPGNFSVRTQEWCLISYADGSRELYDRRADPNEWRNVARMKEHREVLRELSEQVPREFVPAGLNYVKHIEWDEAAGVWRPKGKDAR